VPCPDVFVQDVPAALVRKGLTFQDYFDPRRPAVIDAEHCVRFNFEAWFFADAEGRARFLADPIAYCGLLTDPVSRKRFRPAAGSTPLAHGGVTWFFECGSTRETFARDPELYRLPDWGR
jgi:YHS domain-containing protein